MKSKRQNKSIVLFILSLILFFYIVYILFLVKRIKEIDRQNVSVMDQMRILYELKNEFEANDDSNVVDSSTIIDTSSYITQETEHFSIHTTKRETTMEIAVMAEDAFLSLCSDLRYNHAFNKKIKIFIFKNREEYASKIRHSSWSVGKVLYGKNSFYSYEGVSIEGLIHHELTHLLFYHFLKRKYIPEHMRWLSEGLAMYEESRFIKSELVAILEGYGDVFKEGYFVPIEALIQAEVLNGNNKHKINNWYAQSLSMVKFMIEKYGRRKFNSFCLSFSESENFNVALRKVYGASIKDGKDLQAQWVAFLKKQ